MVRWIDEQHELLVNPTKGATLVELHAHALVRFLLCALDRKTAVLQHIVNVGMARQKPGPGELAPVHGILGAHLVVDRVGVGVDLL